MTQAQIVTKVFLLAVSLKALVEAYLDARNKKHILENRSEVPNFFKERITIEEHQKAADYSVAKIKTKQTFQIFEIAVLLLWTLGGGLEALYKIASDFGYSSIMTGVVFFGLFAVISSFLSLPQSVYTTFVIEERFGFNKTTAKTFIIDMIKGMVLAALLGGPILYAILWIMEGMGDFWWVYGWGFLTAVQFILMWAYPVFIAPLFNKFSPMEEGEVKERVLKLLDKTGFQSNGLFIMNASIRSAHGNAYFTGFGRNKRIVFFDTLIKSLSPDEVEAVLAHELGHFKRKHVVKMLVKAVVMSFIGFFILGVCLNWAPFYEGHGVQTIATPLALALFLIVSGQYTFFLTPINAWSSRRYEFEADEFAASYSSAESLIHALVKLYRENASTLTPDPLYSSFYHSHPPALTRVEFLSRFQN